MRRSLATASLAGAAAWAAPALAPVVAPVARGLRIDRRLTLADGVVLSFDDGPDPQGTPAVLEALRAADARAVFFCVGEQVVRHRSIVGEIVSAGHVVALHCHRHRNLMRLAPAIVREDLHRATATIAAAAGRAPTLHRPPYGIYTPTALAEVRRRGLEPLLWSRWGHDWRRRRAPAKIATEVTAHLRGGDVLLLHDADHYSGAGCWRNTVAALPAILDAISEAGLEPALPPTSSAASSESPQARSGWGRSSA